MDPIRFPGTQGIREQDVTRRAAIGLLVIGGAGAALLAHDPGAARAEDAGECVATAPPPGPTTLPHPTRPATSSPVPPRPARGRR